MSVQSVGWGCVRVAGFKSLGFRTARFRVSGAKSQRSNFGWVQPVLRPI
ncbi:hypothetical protein RISK_005531 [Rhodopirellula islandica]|uniref:Uncharacterized protein n=1 Tax=Rhodopirellula islandica TaxID=595434 RepID=A0A0J1B6N0_RHOIS|nr:hypothetical protein RISK_005531 [Rhodopirellula islandica]